MEGQEERKGLGYLSLPAPSLLASPTPTTCPSLLAGLASWSYATTLPPGAMAPGHCGPAALAHAFAERPFVKTAPQMILTGVARLLLRGPRGHTCFLPRRSCGEVRDGFTPRRVSGCLCA